MTAESAATSPPVGSASPLCCRCKDFQGRSRVVPPPREARIITAAASCIVYSVARRRAVRVYTAWYTGKLVKNSRNGPIQCTIMVPRICIAIQPYSARVYSRAIQDTAYTLYSPIRRSSDVSVSRLFYGVPSSIDESRRHTSVQY